jgi:hypothetical protein
VNHLTAAEKIDHSGFHMVVRNKRGGTYVVGYCMDHAPHATAVEARECYGQFRRDNVIESGLAGWTTCHVAGCASAAQNVWRIVGDGYALTVLCPEHSNREHAIDTLHLAGAAGDSWFS